MKRAFGTDTTKALDEQDTGKILAALKITAQPVSYTHLDVYKRQLSIINSSYAEAMKLLDENREILDSISDLSLIHI